MNKILIFSLLSLFFIGCQKSENNKILEKNNKTPHDLMFMQRAYPSGEILTDAYAKAIVWKKQRLQQKRQSQVPLWELVGPTNIGGRISDIEIPVDQALTYYIGTASGGIFKTTDGGANWNPIFDGIGSLSIGDIEISKNNTNTLWVGTGEANAGGGSLAYDGDGIFVSIDGGITWTSKGLSDIGSIGKVLIDPNDENTVFVGAMGALFKNDTNRGVYRTIDGGNTWQQVLFVSNITGVIDMANHPTNSDIIYAATWERERTPQYRDYGGQTSGIYRSIDGGDTWSELTNGLPSVANEKGRISIDISQSNTNVLYSRYTDETENIQGVYRTSNGGDTWVTVNSSQLDNVGFHWWFRGVFIDPTDENIIYNVDFIVQKSTDGGNSWFTAFPNVHVDQHALAFNTVTDGEVLLGNDGGLYKSTNGGESSVKDLTLPITQFYRFYVDPQNGNKIYGGSQDNSTIRTTTGSLNDWNIINGGDGFQPLIDPNNTNIIFALSQRGNLRKSTNNGASFINATNGISSSDRNNWDTPITFDSQNSQILYYGTQRLWKTTNGAGDWTAISTDLTNGSGGGNLTFGTITTIDVSPLNSDIILTGTDDGNVWLTSNAGSSWNNISNTLPNLWTTKVLADRDNENTIYATFSGYRYAQNLGHVFKSTNAGNTWTDIGSNLPDIPVNDIVKDIYGNLYIATDVGVFSSSDDGLNWIPFGENMPAVVVNDLHIHETEELLYAATYGRSAYKIDISKNPLSTVSNTFEKIEVYPNPASETIMISLPEQFDRFNLIFYDTNGKIIYESNIYENNSTINISHLKTGIYYMKIYINNKTTIKKLIVK